MKFSRIAIAALFMSLVTAPVLADNDDDDQGNGNFLNTDNCVASKWKDAGGNTISIDDKFGAGSMDVTRCLGKTENARVLYQINTECKNSKCDAAYAIGNIFNHINDYKITHGMSADDYEIVVIVHSAGWKLILDNGALEKHSADNPFQSAMEKLIAEDSVKVFFCQNTANGKGVVKANMLDGVGFVTAGVSAISDLQEQGYRYVQP